MPSYSGYIFWGAKHHHPKQHMARPVGPCEISCSSLTPTGLRGPVPWRSHDLEGVRHGAVVWMSIPAPMVDLGLWAPETSVRRRVAVV
jgi:hypothetical protein